MDNINLHIGQNIKNIRTEYNLSLNALSEKSGLSKSMLSSIENGTKSPTISSLWKICDSLHIPLSKLTHISTPEVIAVTKENENSIQVNDSLVMTSLFKYDPEKKIEVHRQELSPGYSHESNGHADQVWEYVLVCDGTLEMNVNQTIYVLKKGEAIQFLATVPHSYSNNGNEELRIFTILHYKN